MQFNKENPEESDTIEFIQVKDEVVDPEWSEYIESKSDPLALPEFYLESKCHSAEVKCTTFQGISLSSSLHSVSASNNDVSSNKTLNGNSQRTNIHDIKVSAIVYPGIWPHTCMKCQTTFSESKYLQRHILQKHSEELPYKCTECDFATTQSSVLKHHMKRHTSYKCMECTFTTSSQYDLILHKKQHKEEIMHKCLQCNYVSFYLSYLQKHVKVKHTKSKHTGEKPFKCEKCDYTVFRKCLLKKHKMSTHAEEYPHKCTECDYISRYSWNLKCHIQSRHSGNLP